MDVLATMDAWQEFFVALGGAAAVLLGLTFIGASIHLERRARALWYRDLAISSGTSLFYALIIALIMLIPEGRPTAQAVLILLFAGLGFQSSRIAFLAARERHPSRQALYFRFLLPLASMVALAVAAVGLALALGQAVWLAAGAAFVNVILGTQNAWDLLLRAATEEE
jgi:hypothetical protein